MNQKARIQERRQKKQRQTTILLLMMGLGVLVVVGAIAYAIISSNQFVMPEIREYQQEGLSGLGDPDAPVVIQEFSDFGCGHCADFAAGTKILLEEEYISTGQVYLEFHSVGGLLGSPQTLLAAEAAYCAAEQEAFWPYHDLLFANQSRLFLNRSGSLEGPLIRLAGMLDLDTDSFSDCLTSGTYRGLAAADESLARQAGVTGTPSFLINGVIFRGNQPFENFQQAIEQALDGISE